MVAQGYGGRVGTLRWDSRNLNGKTIKSFDEATLNAIRANLEELRLKMVAYMKAEAPWHDQPSELHPSAHYPSAANARQGLFADLRGTNILVIRLMHSPGTLWRGVTTGRTYNYGFALEANYNKPDTAILTPTLEAFTDDFVGACANTFTNGTVSSKSIPSRF
jgi:hypothetical protein